MSGERNKLKLFNKLIRELKDNVILVEGKKDKNALNKIGCMHVYPVQGRNVEMMLNLVCKANDCNANKMKVIILTDMDDEGERLCNEIKGVCKSLSFYSDSNVRKELSGLIHVRYWENIENKINKFIKEMEKVN